MTSARRVGDARPIPGDYQHRALTEGPAVQRFWHHAKLGLLDWFFPVLPGERVLDVGCGSGVFADRLAARGATVLGVDASEAAVAYAARTFVREGLSFRAGLLDELDLDPASFDAAVCLEVIEHVHMDQVRRLLADLRRVLVRGGRVLITTPNYRGLWPIVEWATDRFGGAAHMEGDQHVTRFHARLLRDVVQKAGFEVVSLRRYCTFAPFVAAASWRLGDVFERFERRVSLPFGCLLAALIARP